MRFFGSMFAFLIAFERKNMCSVKPIGLTVLLLLQGTLLNPGCATEGAQLPEQLQDEFNSSLTDLNDVLGIGGDESADVFGNLDEDPCEYLSELVNDRGELVPFGYFVGVSGELGLFVARGLVGVDVVFDLYHYQMGTSYYFGAGLGTLSGSVSVAGYAGVARGFQQGVGDWNGWFVSSQLSVGLPFLNDSVGFGTATFVSGVDEDSNHFIDATEILAPPRGVYGYQYSVSLGFDLMMFIPDPEDLVNVDFEVTEALWHSFPQLNRAFYDYFEDSNLYLFDEELSVHLVDAQTGEDCPVDWPQHLAAQNCVSAIDDSSCDPEQSDICVDPETGVQCEHAPECVIEFGERDWTHEHRTQHMFYALCWLTGQCATASGYNMAQASLAAAVLRDSDMTYNEMCPNY